MFSRLFGKKPKKPAQPAPPDLSRGGLEALFGADGVREAVHVVLTQVPSLIDAETKFGGVPGYVDTTRWPTCRGCQDPMMFVGQVAMGPDLPLMFPTPAILYIFLCQSGPDSCESWDPRSGCSSAFAQVGSRPDLQPPRENFIAPSVIERLVADACEATSARASRTQATLVVNSFQQGHKEHRTTLIGQYACEYRTQLSVCDQVSELSPEHYAAMAELGKSRAVFIGGFPDWVQAPSSPECACGKAMEFVLQFNAFDAALNLGDAGEAYVFACPDRCAPTSFALEWQCC
jgi:hypothetical protein